MKKKYMDQLVPDVFLPQDEYYDIPYGAIVSKDIDNLLVAGRCISAEFEAVGSARVIGTCFCHRGSCWDNCRNEHPAGKSRF